MIRSIVIQKLVRVDHSKRRSDILVVLFSVRSCEEENYSAVILRKQLLGKFRIEILTNITFNSRIVNDLKRKRSVYFLKKLPFVRPIFASISSVLFRSFYVRTSNCFYSMKLG